MALYKISEGCWFKDFSRAWLFLVRAECKCGHRTRPCLTLDGASNELIRHQAAAGTRVDAEP
jgi:hypothetical protein